MARGASPAARRLHEPPPISNYLVELGFPHPAGRHRSGRSAFLSLGCWSCRDMNAFVFRGWKRIHPGCCGTSAFARGATFPASMPHEPQPISNYPVWLGFPNSAGRYRPGGPAFSSPGCWSCRDMDGRLIRGWEPILPMCGENSRLARGATLVARRLHEPPPISNHPVGLGFTHLAGRYRPRESAFSSLGCRSCGDMDAFLIRDGNKSSPGAAGPRRWPEGQVSPRSGRFRPGGSAFSSLGSWSCRGRDAFPIRGWELILPGCGGTSALANVEVPLHQERIRPHPRIRNPSISLQLHEPGEVNADPPGRNRPGRCAKPQPHLSTVKWLEIEKKTVPPGHA